MKTKTAMILILLTASMMFALPVNAATFDDPWFIDHAITAVESDYGITDAYWIGSVVTGWHYSPPGIWHKHVTLDGYYGYESTGVHHWEGRVYWDGTIYTMDYSHTEPEIERVVFTTTIKNPQYKYIWNGKQWVYNTPTIIDMDGRTWVIYPKP